MARKAMHNESGITGLETAFVVVATGLYLRRVDHRYLLSRARQGNRLRRSNPLLTGIESNERWTIEVQTPVGAVLDLTRSMPADIEAVMQLH